VYFAVSMRFTDIRISATMFSILMAVANIGTGIGLGISGALSERIGFEPTFLLLAAINILALPLLMMIFPRRAAEAQVS
jgi:PAT family beta-lactamase induction signal transducer AmpG